MKRTRLLISLLQEMVVGFIGGLVFLLTAGLFVFSTILYVFGWLCLGWAIGVDLIVNGNSYGWLLLFAWAVNVSIHIGRSILQRS